MQLFNQQKVVHSDLEKGTMENAEQRAMMVDLGSLLEEKLANDHEIPVSIIGELLNKTPFRAAWRREKDGLCSLLRKVPNVEVCEAPDGGMSVSLVTPPKLDRDALMCAYVDGSYVDAGHGFGGFGGWAALLPGGRLLSGGRSGCKVCDVEVEAILFALENTTCDLRIYSDSVNSIEHLMRPLRPMHPRACLYVLEFQPFLKRFYEVRRGRKITLTYTKSESTWQHRLVHHAARQEARKLARTRKAIANFEHQAQGQFQSA